MYPKYYNHITLSTPLPTQTVVTCLITSAKSKSIWQTIILKLNNHFGKVQVKGINYRAKAIPNTVQEAIPCKKLKNAMHCFPGTPEKNS